MHPASCDLRAARNVPFVEELRFTCGGEGVDLTGYLGTMQVRQYPGQAGVPHVNLATVTSDVEGIRIFAHGAVQIIIAESTLRLMPGLHQPEAGASQVFFYDLVLTDPAGLQQRWLSGKLILEPGVTY